MISQLTTKLTKISILLSRFKMSLINSRLVEVKAEFQYLNILHLSIGLVLLLRDQLKGNKVQNMLIIFCKKVPDIKDQKHKALNKV